MHSNRRVLILSCSARKYALSGTVLAWDLYDGVAFRVVKRLQREGLFPGDVEILILSAQYGLIRPHDKISFYDLRMTKELAAQQAMRNSVILHKVLSNGNYREMLVIAGKTYLPALDPFMAWLQGNITLVIAEGGIGLKLQQLKAWLLSEGPCSLSCTSGGRVMRQSLQRNLLSSE
jgi:Peroxide stress protein YaaA